MFEVQDRKGPILEVASQKDLVALGLVAGELQMEIEEVRPDVREETVRVAGPSHVLPRKLPAVLRMAPVLDTPPLADSSASSEPAATLTAIWATSSTSTTTAAEAVAPVRSRMV